MILSIFSMPLILLHFPGFSLDLYNSLASDLYKTSLTRVDFPEPETPVTQLNNPKGIFTVTSFKLFSLAFIISIAFPFDFLLLLGTFTFSLPLKYLPVIEVSMFLICSAVP